MNIDFVYNIKNNLYYQNTKFFEGNFLFLDDVGHFSYPAEHNRLFFSKDNTIIKSEFMLWRISICL